MEHMNTVMTWQRDSRDLAETEAIAESLGRSLKGGEVIELVSDLGGGKTAFTRGLAKGMGSSDTVSSPSFTISREYVAPETDLVMHHYDFYRLESAGIMADELADILSDPLNVAVVEWGEVVADILPTDRLTIQISKTSDTSRHFEITAGGPVSTALGENL